MFPLGDQPRGGCWARNRLWTCPLSGAPQQQIPPTLSLPQKFGQSSRDPKLERAARQMAADADVDGEANEFPDDVSEDDHGGVLPPRVSVTIEDSARSFRKIILLGYRTSPPVVYRLREVDFGCSAGRPYLRGT